MIELVCLNKDWTNKLNIHIILICIIIRGIQSLKVELCSIIAKYTSVWSTFQSTKHGYRLTDVGCRLYTHTGLPFMSIFHSRAFSHAGEFRRIHWRSMPKLKQCNRSSSFGRDINRMGRSSNYQQWWGNQNIHNSIQTGMARFGMIEIVI